MRLVSWNCNKALHRKWAALEALEPDIAVIQECATPDRLAARIPGFDPDRCLWTGNIPTMGLGVFAFRNWRLIPHATEVAGADYLMPVRVSGPVDLALLAVWALHRRRELTKASRGPVNRALDQLGGFLTDRPALVAGDFNRHVRWDKPGHAYNHADVVDRFAGLGLSSAYHVCRQVEQGDEPEPTIYWRNRRADGPTYHIDYVFAPTQLPAGAISMLVGSHADWVATGLSDHVPLIVDIDDSALRALAAGTTGAVA